jgi:ABC-type multidrug transport system ATPase subunit
MELLHRVGLGGFGRRTIKKPSGGERRRFSLGVSLVNDVPVLFLDKSYLGSGGRARRVVPRWRESPPQF